MSLLLSKILLILSLTLNLSIAQVQKGHSYKVTESTPKELTFLIQCLWEQFRSESKRKELLKYLINIEKQSKFISHRNFLVLVKSEIYKTLLHRNEQNYDINPKITQLNFVKFFNQLKNKFKNSCAMTNWLILSIESDLTPYHRSQTLDSLYTFGQSENNELKKLKKVYHFLKPVIYILQKQNIDQSQTLLAELYLKALQRIDHLSSLYGHLTNPIKNPKKYFSVSLRDNKNLKSNLENLFEQNLEERSKQANETIQNVNKAPLERSKLVDKILQQKDGQKKIQNQWVPEGN